MSEGGEQFVAGIRGMKRQRAGEWQIQGRGHGVDALEPVGQQFAKLVAERRVGIEPSEALSRRGRHGRLASRVRGRASAADDRPSGRGRASIAATASGSSRTRRRRISFASAMWATRRSPFVSRASSGSWNVSRSPASAHQPRPADLPAVEVVRSRSRSAPETRPAAEAARASSASSRRSPTSDDRVLAQVLADVLQHVTAAPLAPSGSCNRPAGA